MTQEWWSCWFPACCLLHPSVNVSSVNVWMQLLPPVFCVWLSLCVLYCMSCMRLILWVVSWRMQKTTYRKLPSNNRRPHPRRPKHNKSAHQMVNYTFVIADYPCQTGNTQTVNIICRFLNLSWRALLFPLIQFPRGIHRHPANIDWTVLWECTQTIITAGHISNNDSENRPTWITTSWL